ncbi:nucleotidyl transferase AbiEii/AbiGii toxin family protein [Actinopolymorpha alba]|uniref:nucleotidyl transferase AbiEii/AbiGii toxin family protein n=1 Tax=Actinopolymorpha alba TaxID=533267 RepID=UPI0003670C51|nr:nucleotidyl transferase AbiEii/AbiGii toxin family protein [Actinopolymorpha alba]
MKYADPASFRRALEDRLKTHARGDGALIARNRKRVVFDRFLARLCVIAPNRWLLKGGFALDLRLAERGRATKDVDLDWYDVADELLDTLLDAAIHDTGDYFTFKVERTSMPPERLGGSHRFRVTGTLAGREFDTFLLDIGESTGPIGHVETIPTPDLLGFAGIEPVAIPTVPLTRQVAEKLHAYTRTYDGGRASTRTKDLVDLALIAQLFPLDADHLRRAIDATFASRATHDRPTTLSPPPTQWSRPFRELAQGVGVAGDLTTGHRIAANLLNPLLSGRITSGSWRPGEQQWVTQRHHGQRNQP